MSIAGLLCVLFALIAVLVLVLYVLQRRDLRTMEEVSQQLQRIAIGGRLAGRVDVDSDKPEIAALVTAVNHLLTRAASATERDSTAHAPKLFAELGERIHEAVLVHSEVILYANRQFASYVGVDRAELIGRRLADLVPPEYTELVSENIRRRLAGESTAERYEIDMVGLQGQISRLEITSTPVEYDRNGALLITGVEVLPTQTLQALRLPEETAPLPPVEPVTSLALESPAPPTLAAELFALDALPAAVIATDTEGRITLMNPAAERLTGADSAATAGKLLEDIVSLVDESDRGVLADPVHQALGGDSAASLGRRALLVSRTSGGERSVELSASPIRNSERDLIGAVVVLHEPTEAPPLEPTAPPLEPAALPPEPAAPPSLAAELLALHALPEAVIATDAEGRITLMNPAAEQLTGADSAATAGKRLEEIVSLVDETDRRLLSDPVHQALSGGSAVNLSRRALLVSRASGSERSIELSASPIRNSERDLIGAVVVLHDVTELRGLARQMSYQATHDALTGLVNRREFERRLQEAIESAHRGDGQHVLCYLDLDRFKIVNDTSGHLAGDSMLREVAKLLRDAVRDSDTVGRLGGDEFGILLVGCPLEKARQIADDVCRAVGDHRFVWRDRIFNIGVSVGLVEISRESGTLEEALAAADTACYVAKKQGSGHVAVYSARDEALARHTGEIQWLQRLQSALKDNRFQLYNQRIIAAHGEDSGPAMEVLVRLQDETGRELLPSEFMRAAERYRLMGPVDRWVVQTTLAALGRGALALPAHRSVAINISGQTLADPQFLEFVVECLDSTGVAPAQICFEISESAVIANLDHTRRFVGVLHGMGCQFALDDFGSGVGSFSNLKNLPLDYLKIDGSFIRNLARDSVNQAMVTAMIKLARTLNFKVIAEQVEDAAALEAARRMGVDYLQGYAISRPQPLQLAA